MGVLSCNRKGCENIMCDRYSKKFGYLCDECFSEGNLSGKPIVDFMQSEKPRYETHDFEKEFPCKRW